MMDAAQTTCIVCLESKEGLFRPFDCQCHEASFCKECFESYEQHFAPRLACPVCRRPRVVPSHNGTVGLAVFLSELFLTIIICAASV